MQIAKNIHASKVLVLLLLLFGLAGCPSTKVVMPPISNNAAQIQTPGKFVWFDLLSTDMTSCENFYDTLFGWDFQRTNDQVARVKTIFREGRAIGNMIGRDAEPGNSQWLSYMSVENVDTALKVVASAGGTIHKEAQDMPNRGRYGVVMDPQGAPFAVLHSPVGDPEDGAPKSNLWVGCELWTTDVDGAISFYKTLAGYEVKTVNVHEKVDYRMLTKNGKRRGGVVSTPWDGMKPEWLPFIGVDNVFAIVTKVESLGGKVLIAPDMSVKGGRVAIIADPSGAVFGIHQLK